MVKNNLNINVNKNKMSRFSTTSNQFQATLEDKENPTVLTSFDFTAIDDMNPSLGTQI